MRVKVELIDNNNVLVSIELSFYTFISSLQSCRYNIFTLNALASALSMFPQECVCGFTSYRESDAHFPSPRCIRQKQLLHDPVILRSLDCTDFARLAWYMQFPHLHPTETLSFHHSNRYVVGKFVFPSEVQQLFHHRQPRLRGVLRTSFQWYTLRRKYPRK